MTRRNNRSPSRSSLPLVDEAITRLVRLPVADPPRHGRGSSYEHSASGIRLPLPRQFQPGSLPECLCTFELIRASEAHHDASHRASLRLPAHPD